MLFYYKILLWFLICRESLFNQFILSLIENGNWCYWLWGLCFYVFLFAALELDWGRSFSPSVLAIIFICLFALLAFLLMIMLFMLAFLLFLVLAYPLALLLLAGPEADYLHTIFLDIAIKIDLLDPSRTFFWTIWLTGWLAWWTGIILAGSTAVRRVSFRYWTLLIFWITTDNILYNLFRNCFSLTRLLYQACSHLLLMRLFAITYLLLFWFRLNVHQLDWRRGDWNVKILVEIGKLKYVAVEDVEIDLGFVRLAHYVREVVLVFLLADCAVGVSFMWFREDYLPVLLNRISNLPVVLYQLLLLISL